MCEHGLADAQSMYGYCTEHDDQQLWWQPLWTATSIDPECLNMHALSSIEKKMCKCINNSVDAGTHGEFIFESYCVKTINNQAGHIVHWNMYLDKKKTVLQKSNSLIFFIVCDYALQKEKCSIHASLHCWWEPSPGRVSARFCSNGLHMTEPLSSTAWLASELWCGQLDIWLLKENNRKKTLLGICIALTIWSRISCYHSWESTVATKSVYISVLCGDTFGCEANLNLKAVFLQRWHIAFAVCDAKLGKSRGLKLCNIVRHTVIHGDKNNITHWKPYSKRVVFFCFAAIVFSQISDWQ